MLQIVLRDFASNMKVTSFIHKILGPASSFTTHRELTCCFIQAFLSFASFIRFTFGAEEAFWGYFPSSAPAEEDSRRARGRLSARTRRRQSVLDGLCGSTSQEPPEATAGISEAAREVRSCRAIHGGDVHRGARTRPTPSCLALSYLRLLISRASRLSLVDARLLSECLAEAFVFRLRFRFALFVSLCP